MTWPEIQEKFGIQSDDVFIRELDALIFEVEQADLPVEPVGGGQQSRFDQELFLLSETINASAEPLVSPRTNRTNTFPSIGDEE